LPLTRFRSVVSPHSWRPRIETDRIKVCPGHLVPGRGSLTRSEYRQETAKLFMDAAKVVDSVIARFIGTKHERDVKKLQPNVAAINALEPEIKALSDED